MGKGGLVQVWDFIRLGDGKENWEKRVINHKAQTSLEQKRDKRSFIENRKVYV